jgi:1-acyl-sn-glycerol-3-phosphate acyltransferase
MLRTSSSGASLAFFPEGTFETQPGLLRFHSGAFVAAARSGYPIVPVVIRGTRRAMPSHRWWPHPGVIEVEVLPAITPTAATPEAAVLELKARARALILARLGEPDLAP